MNFNRLRRTIDPAFTVVSIDEAKLHLRVDGSDEDDLISQLIEAATAAIDGPNGIGIALAPQTYRYSIEPDQHHGHHALLTRVMIPRQFTIPVYPVRAITAFEWTDPEGNPQTTTNYSVDLDANPARVYFNETHWAKPGTIKLTFTAGFSKTPADLRQAILLMVGHFYANREAVVSVQSFDLPLGVNTILERYRAT